MSAARDLRSRLRAATQAPHERMHGHPGFAAAAAGRIDARAYRDLLARLYGFHRVFDAAREQAPHDMAEAIALSARLRSADLAADLRELGVAGDVEALPRCLAMSECVSEPQWLGALYVIEGSTLGGAQIARALERAGFVRTQRRFFEAYGERRSWMWRTFLARLETHANDPRAGSEAESSARALFESYEVWMRDWEGAAATL